MPLCLCIWLTGLSCSDFQGGGRPRSVGWSKLPLPARVGCGGRGGRAPHAAEEVCQLLTTQSTESRALFFFAVFLLLCCLQKPPECLLLSQGSNNSGPKPVISPVKFGK